MRRKKQNNPFSQLAFYNTMNENKQIWNNIFMYIGCQKQLNKYTYIYKYLHIKY